MRSLTAGIKLTVVMDRLILRVKRPEILISHINGLVYLRHWDGTRAVVQDVDKARIAWFDSSGSALQSKFRHTWTRIHCVFLTVIPIPLGASCGERGYWSNEDIHRSTSPADLLGAVPVLHVLLLPFSFGYVRLRNLTRCRLLSWLLTVQA